MNDYYPFIKYNEPVFRPPAEAGSLIFQVTYGCSWNKCSFCEMYASKTFRTRSPIDVIEEIKSCQPMSGLVKKVFLADGNAFVLREQQLLPILLALRETFPRLQRVSAYALPSDILRKTPSELENLRNAGLKLLYVGVESGNQAVLSLMNKSETPRTTLDGLLKARDAGFDLSLMIINGLGGKLHMSEHAIDSAKLVNDIQPKYLSTLVLSYPFGTNHLDKRLGTHFIPLTIRELICEMQLFIQNLELSDCIFRSDHASNFLVLKGILDKDKRKILENISFALDNPMLDKLHGTYSGEM